MFAEIGSNGQTACVNKTKGSRFMLYIHHIRHSMLGHNVALSSLENRECIYDFLLGVLESS